MSFRQSTGYYTEALDLIGGIMLLSTVLPFPGPSAETFQLCSSWAAPKACIVHLSS